MSSPEPRVLPSTCAAPAFKQRMSLLHASPASILPEVRQPGFDDFNRRLTSSTFVASCTNARVAKCQGGTSST